MPVLPPLSVTQSTALSANSGAGTDAAAWQSAIASTQAPVRQSRAPSANNTPPPQKPTSETAPVNQIQPAPADGTASVVAAQAEAPKAPKPHLTSLPTAPAQDKKKNTLQVLPVAGLAAQIQPAMQKPVTGGVAKAQTQTSPAGETAPSPTAQTGVAAADNSTDIAKANPPTAPVPAPDQTAPAHIAANTKPATAVDKAAAPADPAGTPPLPAAITPAITPATAGATQNLARASTTKAAPPLPVSEPVVASTAQALITRAAQPLSAATFLPGEKDKHSTTQITGLGGANASHMDYAVTATGASTAIAQTSTATAAGNAGTSPAALAATVTALHQSGQASTILRLDPPGLGHLSVQVGVGTQGQVNVLFVPSSADAAQTLHASLPNLGVAMAQSGLMLGQAQVGGQFSQQGGQNGQGRQAPPRQTYTDTVQTKPQTPENGLSAYA